MQLSQLIMAVRDEVQDLNALRWSDLTITRYLNDALLDLASASRGVRHWVLPVTGGTFTLNLPLDLLIPQNFWFAQGGQSFPLETGSGPLPVDAQYTGFPHTIYILANQVRFFPTPAQGGELHISGIPRPAELKQPNDFPSIQDADSILVEFAIWRCLSSDGDPGATPKRLQYQDMRMQWTILEAQKHPFPNRIEGF